MLSESLGILTAAWSGQPVNHHGPHCTVDGIQFLLRPVQRPGVPRPSLLHDACTS
jgi:alkanesulfonate monooxygenase SsuD/methylene tetrahydromethanopterin reductase-like flavin-dependent oxidoreductase (luciferase family)